MTLKNRKPLVLVVEDDEEFRERILPSALEEVGSRVLRAASINEALKTVACRHDIRSDDPVDLVVLDMRLPVSPQNLEIEDDAGVRFLNYLLAMKEFHLVSCPIIVFTAYPSYRNCVAAAKAGAAAYIPKQVQQDSGEGGIEDLINTCQRLLFAPKGVVSEAPPTNEWLNKNGDWLHSDFHGKWVTFLPEAVATSAGLVDRERYPLRDGIVLVSGNSYDDVRRVILEDSTLHQELPVIVMVAPTDQDTAHGMED